jgi:hypothetical protein
LSYHSYQTFCKRDRGAASASSKAMFRAWLLPALAYHFLCNTYAPEETNYVMPLGFPINSARCRSTMRAASWLVQLLVRRTRNRATLRMRSGLDGPAVPREARGATCVRVRATMPEGDVIPHTLVGLHDGCTSQIARASGLRTLQIAGAGAAIKALASH